MATVGPSGNKIKTAMVLNQDSAHCARVPFGGKPLKASSSGVKEIDHPIRPVSNGNIIHQSKHVAMPHNVPRQGSAVLAKPFGK